MLAQCLLFVAVATWIMVLTGEASGRFEILIILAAALFPILMTAFVLVASMLPLSLELAPGSEAMAPLARALIGGMLVSTFLTLFLVPCVYAVVKPNPQPATA